MGTQKLAGDDVKGANAVPADVRSEHVTSRWRHISDDGPGKSELVVAERAFHCDVTIRWVCVGLWRKIVNVHFDEYNYKFFLHFTSNKYILVFFKKYYSRLKIETHFFKKKFLIVLSLDILCALDEKNKFSEPFTSGKFHRVAHPSTIMATVWSSNLATSNGHSLLFLTTEFQLCRKFPSLSSTLLFNQVFLEDLV